MTEPVEPSAQHGRTVALDASTVVTRGLDAFGVDHGALGQDTIEDVARRDDERELTPGSTVGRYVILERLGAGGMGTVYAARDPDLDRPVAIKVLRGAVHEEARLRMEREARALARLSHPNVVQVYEIGRAEGHTFISMELVRGQPLDQWQRADLAWRECVRVYEQAGRGLAAAHAEGLVHRDFKPGNCILGDDGRVRVLDFGLARMYEPGESATEGDTGGRSAPVDSLTRTGFAMGTPAYMALEQLQGQGADAASDQFGFCVALWEAIYGTRPFVGRSMKELALSISEGRIRQPPPARRVPKALRRVLLRGLAPDPAARWSAMDELLAALVRLIQPRRRSAVALLGGGLLVVGGGLWQQARVAAAKCEGASEALAGVWDPARRERLEAAISGSARTYSAAAATWAVERLDDYASAWASMHEDVCEATHVRHEQTDDVMDLRMACLGRRKLALREAVDVLEQADAGVVERASDVVSSLPSLLRCEDVEALRAAVPPPDDPEQATRVQAVRTGLARVKALAAAGLYDDALAKLEPLREETEALAYVPLQAELAYQRGAVLQSRGEPAAAATELEHAFSWALEHGHDEVATDAAVSLVFVVGAQQGQLVAGRQWGTIALALAHRTREPSADAAARLHLSMVLREQGHIELALEHAREGLALMERLRGSEHPDVALALGVLARGFEERGELGEALATLRRGLAIEEQVLGPEHPFVATSAGNIGRLLAQRGELSEAVTYLERSRAIYERVGDRGSLAGVLSSLARVRHQQGNPEQAVALLERALEQAEAGLGSEHPDVAVILSNLGGVHLDEGRLESAEPLLRRALAILEATLGPDHVLVADAADNLGMVLRETGAHDEAVTLHRRSLAIREQLHGGSHSDLAGTAFELGLSFEARGQRAQARQQVERALAIYATIHEAEAEDVAAEARTWLDEHPEATEP